MTAANNPCFEFFQRIEGRKDKVAQLALQPDKLAWEGISASGHSPGPVKDGERIVRTIYSPLHFEDGKLTPMAVSDAKDKGCSTDRIGYTTAEALVSKGMQTAKAANAAGRTLREFHSLCAANVCEVRALTHNSLRAFGVYDTANCENPAHADVCLLVDDEKFWRRTREELRKLFRPLP